MGGIAAEMAVCGNAVGGAGDLEKLVELVANNETAEDWVADSTQIAMSMVHNHRVEFNEVESRVAAGATVQSCVAAAEAATQAAWYQSMAASTGYPHVRGHRR